MDVILSFDSEDFVTSQAADAERWVAAELSDRGLRGSFQCVAELLRAARRQGRDDVLSALGRHELGYHSDLHSVPPTHAETLEDLTLEQGVAWVREREAGGLKTFWDTFGRRPVSYCQPGRAIVPAALLAMAAAGISVCCGSPLGRSTPLWYCGLLTTRSDLCLDRCLARPDPDAAFEMEFAAASMAAGDDGLVVITTHPARIVTSAFWDAQFYGGRRLPREEWRPAPLVSPAAVQRNKDFVRRCLDGLQRRADVRFTCFADLLAAAAPGSRGLDVLLEECGLRRGQEGQLPLRPAVANAALSADDFAALRYAWGPLPAGFTGSGLRAQAAGLAWTAKLASRTSSL